VSGSPAFDRPLPKSFYSRDVSRVARDLLGCYLVRRRGRGFYGGKIVETEAYGGPGDPGSHADRAPNGRARIMFGEPGFAYVYFTYGMHHCLNAVSEDEGSAGAVLIRAIEPVWGVEGMRRGAPERLADGLIASGPGRLCRALDVDRRHNGSDLTEGPIRVAPGDGIRAEVHRGPRVGLSSDDGREWRYWLSSPSVSRARISRRHPDKKR
jgi:DNA-3-methyladenine glycosylase